MHPSRYPSDFDSIKFQLANERPQERTLLRLMAPRLKPNGYFYGAPGVMPDGEVFMDILKRSPQYDKRGFVKIYYMYLVGDHDFLYDDFHLRKIWSAAKIDTFQFHFGPPLE